MRIPLQASLRDASSPKGAPLGNTANFTAFRRKAVPLGKVDASETSRRREFMRPERPNHLLQLCCLMYSSD